MALPTITLVNLTVGDINLEQLAVVVPGSGSIDVSDFDRAAEVLNDAELQVEMDAGNIRIDLTGGGLSSADTTKTLEQSKGIVKPIHDLDIKHNMSASVAPVVGDDEDDGYEVGSIWIDTTADTYYVCADAAAGAAVWVANGGGATTRIAQSGVLTEGLRFFVDVNNQSSWVPNQLTTWTDTIADDVGTATAVAIIAGHLNFYDGAVSSNVTFGNLSSALATAFASGGNAMAWIRPESDGPTSFGRVFDAGFPTGTPKNYVMYVFGESAGFVQLAFYHAFTGTDGIWSTTSAVVPIDEFTHVSVDYDSDLTTNVPIFYINGVSVAVTTNVTPTGTSDTSTTKPLVVGADSDGTDPFDGDIDMLSIYDVSQVATAVVDTYNATKPRFGVGTPGTWAATLDAGEFSGGTNAVMTNGDTLQGEDVTSGSGGILALRGGDTTVTGLVNGGDVTIDGGEYAGTSGFGRGGNLTLQGGPVTSTGGNGGAINLIASTPGSNNGTGGAVFITSGDGGTGGGNATGGNLSILSGDGKVSGAGGTISIACGDSISFGGGADMSLTAGSCTGPSGTGGDLNLDAGAGSEVGGNVNIKAGAKTVAFGSPINSGNVSIESGAIGVGGGWKTGNISIEIPQVTSPGSTNAYGGTVTITAGNTGLSNNDGGDVNITAGETFGGNGRQGGHVNITCGAENNGNSFSLGGSVFMTPGTSGSGGPGQVFIQGTGSMAMLERAAAASMSFYVPVAGYGRWWVRNDAPNVPMFTDDAGTDWVLNETGATDLQGAYEGGNTIVTDGGNGNLDVSGTQSISLTSSLGTISLDCTGSGNFSCSSGTLLLSALNVNVTALGANAPGDITLTGSTAAGLGNAGGDIIAISGGGDAAGAGGQASISAGTAGATGVGGLAKLRGGQGGATSGDGGAVSITGGQVTEGIGGAVIISAGDAAGTAHLGGAVTITAGDGVTTSTGGQATIQAGEGGATGNGGKVNVLAGAGGATSGNGGGVGISSGVPVDGDGGTIGLIAAHGVGVNKSGGTITLDAGNSTGTTAGAEIDITSGDGSASSVGGAVNITGGDGRTGGDVVITSGGPLGALEAGDVRIIADKAGGTAGKITLTTESDDVITAPVAISTQSGFVDQAAEHRTFASSDAITNGVTNQVVVDLGSITTNGHNLKVVLSCTATDAVTDSNFVSYRYVGDFYRSGGTVTAVTAFEDTNTLVGTANWTSNISFHIGISGGTVRLELDNAGGSGTDNFNLAIGTMSVVQLGGRTA